MEQELLSTKEAASMLDLSVEHIGWLLRNKKLQGRKLGRDWVVLRASAEEYAQKWHKPGPKRPAQQGEGSAGA